MPLQDLIRLLKEHPDLRVELRQVLLTQELLELPERLNQLLERLARMEARQARIEASLNSLEKRVGNLGFGR